MTPKTIPDGLCMFLDSKDMQAEPADIVARLNACGATSAGVLILSVDGRKQPEHRVRSVCAALRAAEIVPLLFAFPPPSKVEMARAHIETMAAAVACPRVLLDLEPYDDDGDHEIDLSDDWSEAEIASLVGGLVVSGLSVTISLYTRSQWDRINWTRCAPGIPVELQAYERWETAKALAAALRRWDSRPVGVTGETYKGDLGRLRACLAVLQPFARSHGHASIWSLRTTSPAEAAILLAWALDTWRAP